MKAVIHIGLSKTGTTTIQSFLGKNRELLKRQGFFYPISLGQKCAHYELSAMAFISEMWKLSPLASFLGNHTYSDFLRKDFVPQDQQKLLAKFVDGIMSHCLHDEHVIFSDEVLAYFTEVEVKRFKNIFDSFFNDFTIVMYLRRQPECLVSFYNTLASLSSPWNFADYLNLSEEDSFLAYHKIVKHWSIFGKDKLKIRVFDKQELHDSDLLSDFAHTVGFGMTGLERVKNVSISIDSACTEFLRLFNVHCPMMQDS